MATTKPETTKPETTAPDVTPEPVDKSPEAPAPKVYRATQSILFNGVLAHTTGDLVPEDNVTRNGWESLVEEVKS